MSRRSKTYLKSYQKYDDLNDKTDRKRKRKLETDGLKVPPVKRAKYEEKSNMNNKDNLNEPYQQQHKSPNKNHKTDKSKLSKSVKDKYYETDSNEEEDDDLKDDRNINPNQELIDVFHELAEYEFAQKQRFKGSAYRKIENKLKTLQYKVTSGSKVKHLPGFGKAAVNKIDEYLQHKKVKRLEMYRTEYGSIENCKLQHKTTKKRKK